MRSLRDLDAAALRLRAMGQVILDETTPDAEVRRAVFKLMDRETLSAAVERVGALDEPQDEIYFAELRKFSRKIRYAPALLTGLELGAAPAGKPLLEAVEYLRGIHAGGKRPGPAPTAFASKDWAGQIKTEDGSIDLVGYRLCVLDGLRRAIRRRDVFPVRSLRYADPRKGLLSGAAWEAARPAICRTIGVSASGAEELGRLSQRLDLAYREVAERVPANPRVGIVNAGGKADLSVEALDRSKNRRAWSRSEPPSTPCCHGSTCQNSSSKWMRGQVLPHISPTPARTLREPRILRQRYAPCWSPRRRTRDSSLWFGAICQRSGVPA